MLWTFKPRLRVRARVARAGEPLDLVIVVDAPEPIPVTALRVRVVSEIESADARATVPVFSADLLVGERRIRAGRSEYPCRVELPASLPPRIDAYLLRVRHRVEVSVDVPWGKGASVRLELPVVPALPKGDELPSGEFASEARIDSLPLLAGRWEQHEHDLRVTIDVRRPLSVDELAIKLVGRAEAPKRSPVELWTLQPVPGDDREGSARFVGTRHERRFALHPALPGSFTTPHGGLNWYLVIHSRWFGRKAERVEIPLELRSRQPYTRGHLRPERVEAELVSQQPLSPADEQAALVRGLAVDDGRIVGHVAGSNLLVHRELDGRRPLLVAEVTFPSLELGMHLRAAAPGEHAPIGQFARPVTIDASRDPAQVQALCSRLTAAASFELIRLDDSHLRLEARESSLGLAGFLTDLLLLLRSLAAARPELPPSRVVEPYRADWENLAEWLDGTLHPAAFRLAGTLVTIPAEVAIVWDGPLPARTRLALRPPALAIEPGRRYRWVGGDASERRAPELVDRQLALLAQDTLAVSIGADEVSVELAGAVGEQVIRRHLQRMARVVDELRLGGAYR